jgi:hypothetical protein
MGSPNWKEKFEKFEMPVSAPPVPLAVGARNSGWLHKSRNAFLKQTQEKLAHI